MLTHACARCMAGWMYVARKPHPEGNEYHTIACSIAKVIFWMELVEGKDSPPQLARKKHDELGKTVGLVLRCAEESGLQGSGKIIEMDSGFSVLEALIRLRVKGVFGAFVIKKRR